MRSVLRSLFFASLLVVTGACTKVNPDVSVLMNFLKSTGVPTVSFSVATQTLSASNPGPFSVLVELSVPALTSTMVTASTSGTAAAGTNYTGTFSVLIPAGSTTGAFLVSPVDTGENSGSTNLVLTLDPVAGYVMGAQSVSTVTLVKDHLGSFVVNGVKGGTDVTEDAFLNTTLAPTIRWTTSAGAASYEVSVFTTDLATNVCGTQTTTSLVYNFSSCTLTVGQSYKAKVVAISALGTNQLTAANSFFDFLVNSPPVPATFSVQTAVWSTAININPLVAGAPTSSCGVSGCTLSVSSVTNGTLGLTSVSSNLITYTPSTTSGDDTFTYTLTDGRGGTATGTIQVKVRSPYTWIGAGGSSAWSNPGNWLGGAVPITSSIAVFDDYCTANCSPTGAGGTIKGLVMDATYTGTITLGSALSATPFGLTLAGGTLLQGSNNINLTTSAPFNQTGGTFTGGSGNFVVAGAFSQSGGYFRAPSLALTVSGNMSITGGTFLHNNGTVNMSGNTISVGSTTFKNLAFLGNSVTKDLGSSNPTVAGNLTTSCTTCVLNGAGSITALGNVTFTQSTKGNLNIIVGGNSGGQTISAAGTIPNLSIIAGAYPVTFGSLVNVAGDYYYSPLNTGTLTTTGSTLTFGVTTPTQSTPVIIPGNVAYNNVTFTGPGAFDLNGNILLVNQNLSLSNLTAGSRINNGTLKVLGNATASSSVATGSAVVQLAGSTSQSLSCSAGFFPNLEIASTGPVNFASSVQVAGNYTYTSGSMTTSYPLIFGADGASAIDVTNSTPQIIPGAVNYTSGVVFKSPTAQIFDLNSNGLTAGNLVVDGTNGLKINNGGFDISGSVASNLFTSPSSASLIMSGATSATLTTNGTFGFGSLVVNKTSATVNLGSALAMNAAGQSVGVVNGSLNLLGYAANFKTLTMSPGTNIYLGGGALTVNGTGLGAGSYGGGTINP